MKFNRIYELFDNPKILFSCGSKFWNTLEGDKNQKSYLLTHPMWYFSFSSLPRFLKLKRELTKKNIDAHVIREKTLEVIKIQRNKFYELYIALKGDSSPIESFDDFHKRFWGAIDSMDKLCVFDIEDNYAKIKR